MVDVGGGGTLVLAGEGAYEGLYVALDVTAGPRRTVGRTARSTSEPG
jgi:hypothetical protein